MSWIIYTLSGAYKISQCTQDRLAITEEDIKNKSLFEDNSFIETPKNNNDNSIGNSTVFSYEYKANKFYVNNANCDGRGPGPVPFEKFAVDSYKIENARIITEVETSNGSVPELNDRNSVKYQIVYKITSNKLYPLSIEML